MGATAYCSRIGCIESALGADFAPLSEGGTSIALKELYLRYPRWNSFCLGTFFPNAGADPPLSRRRFLFFMS